MMTEPNKSRRRGDKLQNDIYEATYRLLETEGYSAINFTRIAREANTSRSVVYRYWDTPFDLVFAAVRQRMQQAEARFENLDFDRGSLRDHLVYVGQHFILESNNGPFRLFKMLFSEMINQQERERTGQMLAEATESNIKIMDDVLQRAIQRGKSQNSHLKRPNSFFLSKFAIRLCLKMDGCRLKNWKRLLIMWCCRQFYIFLNSEFSSRVRIKLTCTRTNKYNKNRLYGFGTTGGGQNG